jgi:streptogramin lyase
VGSIAIDGSGNVWTFNASSTSNWVTKLSPLGSVLSGANGYPVGSDVVFPAGRKLAIDQNGNAWLTGSTYIYRISGSGTVSAFQPDEGSAYYDIAIDGSGNVWTNSTSGTPNLVELSPSGTDLHFTSPAPIGDRAMAIDASGTVWTTGLNSVLFGTSIATGTNVNVTGSITGFTGVAIDSVGDVWAMYSSPGGGRALTLFTYNSLTNAYSPFTNPPGSSTRPLGLTIDGSNTVWLASNYPAPSVDASYNNGSGISPIGSIMYNPNGEYNTFANGIATDPSGDIWITSGSVIEFIGASTPVVTPLSVGVKNHTIATRP